MDIRAYLKRIGAPGGLRPDLASLRLLHRAHLLAIPYENLDVQLGKPVGIQIGPIYNKLVSDRRGGWCYEMNGLFGWALGELGFRVSRVSGAVMRSARGADVEGNHVVLRVDVDEGTYLADVGLGDGPIEPVAVAEGPFMSHGFAFRLERVDAAWWRLHNHPKGGAKSFDFRLDAGDEAAFERQCAWLQRNPQSTFVQHLVCQRYTEDGLWILRGRVLRSLRPTGHVDRLLESPAELVDVLGGTFDLDVPKAAGLWKRICERHAEFLRRQATPFTD